MTAYKKLAGAWNPAQRIYVRSQGTWMPSDVVYVKRNGTWQIAHNYDVTPPDAPQISLELVDTEYWDSGVRLLGRYINVSVRQAATTHDTTLARIRVLSSYNGRPP